LRAAGIPFDVNTNLVRGLDYYNRTVFEIVSGELGAQNSLAGGGRYDGLLKSLGGADLPAFGFGCGLERLIQSALRMSDKVPKHPRPDLILIPMSENEAEICQGLAQQLRQQGFSIELYVGGKKLKQAMKYANTVQARFCVVLGEHEAASSEIDLKNMDSGQTECHCSIANLPAELALRRSPV
jgi:histidyl-tRNA synthetase